MKKAIKLIVSLFVLFAFFQVNAQEAYTLSSDSKLTIDGTSTVHDWTVTANTISGTLKAEGDSPKEIDVVLIEGADVPGPVGEPPLGPIGAAIGNAVRRLTGERLVELPLSLG